ADSRPTASSAPGRSSDRGPGKRLVPADGHGPDGKEAAVVVGPRAHGVAGVVHVQHNGVLLGIPVYPTVFAADGHLLPRRKIDASSEEHTSELQSRFDLVC